MDAARAHAGFALLVFPLLPGCSPPGAPSLDLHVQAIAAPAEQYRSLADYRHFDMCGLSESLGAKRASNEDVLDQIPSRYVVVQVGLDTLRIPGATIPMSDGTLVDSHRRGSLIPELYDALLNVRTREQSNGELACLPAGAPRLLVVADERVPLQPVAQVRYTAGQAQFGAVDLAVADPAALEQELARVSGRAPAVPIHD